MSGPKPDKWSDLLRPTYEYPSDLADDAGAGLRGRRRRKAVRQARRDWRSSDRAARQQWVREQVGTDRTREPDSRLGVVTLVAVIVLVVGIGSAVRGCASAPAATVAPTSSATPTSSETAGSSSTAPSATTSPTVPPAPSSEPTVTAPTPSVDASADDVALAWARAWNTYAPSAGETGWTRLDRVDEISTPELVEWMNANDTTSSYYDVEGVDLVLDAATIEPLPEGAAPVDTDERATRRVVVTTTAAGQTTTRAHDLTLTRGDSTVPWLVAYVEDVVDE